MKIKTRRYYIYYLLKISLYVIRAVPRKLALMSAVLLGKCAFRVLGKYRRIAVQGITKVLGDDLESGRRMAEKVFIHLAKNGVDWIKMTGCSKLCEQYGFGSGRDRKY